MSETFERKGRESRVEPLYQALIRKKDAELASLETKVRKCARENNCQPVLGSGFPMAEAVFVKGMPGRDEIGGASFQGFEGKAIWQACQRLDLSLAFLYGTNIPKCKGCLGKKCLGFLREEIEIIEPQFLVVLGGEPFQAVREVYEQKWSYQPGQVVECQGFKVLISYDVGLALKSKSLKSELWEHLKLLKEMMGALS